MSYRAPLTVGLIVTAASLAGCWERNQEPLSYGEALQALEETQLSTQATTVVGGTIELSTNFTIGEAVERAAEELGDFIASQLPCADITLVGHELTVVYGAKPGQCTYRGQSYSGTHVVTVERTDSGDLRVDHEWTELSNGELSVSGTANVTWSSGQGTRRVVHELDWTRLEDGKTGTGSGDVVQRTLEEGLLSGIQLDGAHAWEGVDGRWDLEIEAIEARWIDPVPQAGRFLLTTPTKKKASMEFERVDAHTIAVIVTSGERQFTINVTSFGG